MTAFGVILARGGSKRLPRKNIRELAGRPLIAYTIEAARNSTCLRRTIVSTEDAEVAEVAVRFGGDVPFIRPADLAQDDTPSISALIHAVEWLEQTGQQVETVVLLQPTSPLRTSDHIDAVVGLYKAEGADTAISVTDAPVHPFWCWRESSAYEISPYFTRSDLIIDRNSLPRALVANGAVYAVRRGLLGSGSLYGDRVVGYLMSEQDSIDIDTADDFARAERVLLDKTRKC